MMMMMVMVIIIQGGVADDIDDNDFDSRVQLIMITMYDDYNDDNV